MCSCFDSLDVFLVEIVVANMIQFVQVRLQDLIRGVVRIQQDGVSVREYINYRLEQPDEAYLYWDHIYDWQEDGTLRDEDGKFLMRVVFVGEEEFQAIIHLGSRIVEREPLVTKEVYGLADFVRMTDEELDACRKKYDKEYFDYLSTN